MGIRNKVAKDGFVQTSVSDDSGLFGFEQQFLGASASTAITTGLTILSGTNVTASLPTIATTEAADGTVANGIVCKVLLASPNTFLLTSSVPINGGAWTFSAVAASSAFKILECVGVTGLIAARPIQWFINSGSVAV